VVGRCNAKASSYVAMIKHCIIVFWEEWAPFCCPHNEWSLWEEDKCDVPNVNVSHARWNRKIALLMYNFKFHMHSYCDLYRA
jgi:hypothetical protein